MQTLIRGPVLGKSGGKRLAKGLCPEGKQDPSRAYSWGNDVLGFKSFMGAHGKWMEGIKEQKPMLASVACILKLE